jgi:hypothetical protein
MGLDAAHRSGLSCAAMELAALERRLQRGSSAKVLTDARLLRRVIKRHRHLAGVGLHVPHARCYAVSREALLSIVEPDELGWERARLPAEVILLPRPSAEELARESEEAVLTQLWRHAFHAEVHLALERRVRDDLLGDTVLRQRVHRIGQTEFDEIRAVLRQDELLLPPHDDREAYIELCAIWLELKRFDPALLSRMFPTLHDQRHVDAVIALDVDAGALLEGCRPEGLDRLEDPRAGLPEGAPGAAAHPRAPAQARAPSAAEHARRLAEAEAARARGNLVRAALQQLGARSVASAAQEEAALAGARADLDALLARVEAALGGAPGAHAAPAEPSEGEQGADSSEGEPGAPSEGEQGAPSSVGHAAAAPALPDLLLRVAEQAGAGLGVRATVEARFLHDLQRAAEAHERPLRAVDLITFLASFGRRKIVRPLPRTAPLRVVRCLRHAQDKLPRLALTARDRRALSLALRHLLERAEEQVREALRPALLDALAAVGLRPANVPERVAQRKLVEELLDQAIAQGFLGIGQLRDALSRNQLKLEALAGPGELVFGDALLQADRLLAVSLDGVYRPGEIYLRVLQKVSSLAFGTGPGRLFVLYVGLPFGASFVVLEGLSHIVGPISHHLGHGHVHLLTPPAFVAVGVAILGLVHSAALRAAALTFVRTLGAILKAIFVGIPRWIARLPLLRALVESRPLRWIGRYLLKPLVPAALLFLVPRLRHADRPVAAAVGIGAFLLANLIMNSRLGSLAEEVALDWSAQQWRFLSRRVLLGAFHLLIDVFKAILEGLERGIHRIDEWLRFRQGESKAALVLKGAIGALWFFVAYLVRVYINVLIEPQINPIKHFPVVTVAAKILVPMSPGLIAGLRASLAPVLGEVAATTVAGPTVLLLPGFFGFLVWELKENWKLYRQSRLTSLRPVSIGHHGETMGALMKPGFHSGTLPKLHGKLRRAARKGAGDAGKYEELLREGEEGVRRFVDRELVALLALAPRFRAGPLTIQAVELGSNRVRIELCCPAISALPCAVSFEEQSGLILASVPEPVWIDALPDEERQIFENALAGLYQLAGVDVVREQLEAAIAIEGRTPDYDISEAGLVVWPRRDYRSEVVYTLGRGSSFTPKIRGEVPAESARVLTDAEIFFRVQQAAWSSWVAAWSAAEGDAPIPRVAQGASLLPPRSTLT